MSDINVESIDRLRSKLAPLKVKLTQCTEEEKLFGRFSDVISDSF